MEGTKFYIASSLDNAGEVQKLGKLLTKAGWTWTYDWTQHGSVRGDAERLKEVAKLETQGVLEADIVVVLLPGGRGTHTELGMAVAAGKEIVLNDMTGEAFSTGEATCSFYHHPAVFKATLPVEQLAYMLTVGREIDDLFNTLWKRVDELLDPIMSLVTRGCTNGTKADKQERLSK